MPNGFELPPQKTELPSENYHENFPNIVHLQEDLRDLYRSTSTPIEILLQTMETAEFKAKVSENVSNQIKEKLRKLVYVDENDFVVKVVNLAGQILTSFQRGEREAVKQGSREMFSVEDIRMAVDIIRTSGSEKIYVVGNVGSGKTTFSREIARILGYKNIDLDKWFQLFFHEYQRDAVDLKELLDYVLIKENPPFIINHADLLRKDLILDGDLVIFLNPSKEEHLRSRQIRIESEAEGEWKVVDLSDYDQIEEQNMKKFKNIGGVIKYENKKSGTAICVLKKE